MPKQNEEKREFARLLFMQGEDQKTIAAKVGTSAVTINRWVAEGNWKNLRAASTVSRKELVNKMLLRLDEKLETDDWTADEIAKASKAIANLDKQTNVVTIIEVFTSYNQWLIARMKLDPELTPELVQVMNRYQDIFISEMLTTTKIS